MTFDHLSDADFEELLFDLLDALGFVNLGWRRGTGRSGASPDQGRDIQAQLRRQEVDQTQYLEIWFVQCKRHQRGVPPEKLQGALAWAVAERPHVLLIAVSNFLSNPAKNWLENYEKNNQPAFRIKVWERKDLERLARTQPDVAAKYSLEVPRNSVTIHPAHTDFILRPSHNSLRFFFETLESVDETARDELFEFAYYFMQSSELAATREHAQSGGSPHDVINYSTFKHRCIEVAECGVAEFFVVEAVLFHTLARVRRAGDPATLPRVVQNHEDTIAYLREQLHSTSDADRRRSLTDAIDRFETMMTEAPKRQRRWASHYAFLCETILPRLELEEARWLFSLSDGDA